METGNYVMTLPVNHSNLMLLFSEPNSAWLELGRDGSTSPWISVVVPALKGVEHFSQKRVSIVGILSKRPLQLESQHNIKNTHY